MGTKIDVNGALSNCERLVYVNLDENQIGDKGAKKVAKALPGCTYVRTYVRTYVHTHARTHARTYVRT